MKKDKFLELMNEIDDDLLEGAAAEPKTKKNPFIKIALIAAVVALISAISITAFVMMKADNYEDIFGDVGIGNDETSQAVIEDVLQETIDDTFWNDTRKRNEKTYLGAELAIEWPWNCKGVYSQYTSVNINGIQYNAKSAYWGMPMNENAVGQKIGDFICVGEDYISGEKHSISCSVYKIKGVDSSHIVAVKYEGYDEYYPFKPTTSIKTPTTLGELIRALDLTNNIVLNDFYYAQDGGDVHYRLSKENSAEIWNIIQKYADVKTELMYENKWNRKVLSFAINSDTLGVKNLSFSFNQEGYLITNIEDYGYYYNIGVDAVNEIADYAMKNRLIPLKDETQYLVGTVTEIGENYIKVDDSVLMKNPEDGIEFTVYANHMNIKRYIISGYLRVGQTVKITHGYLPKESYTQIQNATYLDTCIITSNGQTLIPE